MGAVKPVVAIQCRMSSKRLPGKVMADLCGEPMIRRIWDSLEADAWNRVILTSTHPSDDPLAQYAIEVGMIVKAGPLEDVLGRYIEFLRRAKPPILVRVCGDAPFLRKSWIHTAIDHVQKEQEPVFVPGALHAGAFEDWLECVKDTPNWHPDREHAGHDWFQLNGKTIDLVPDGYMTVNTQEELDEARRRWAAKK